MPHSKTEEKPKKTGASMNRGGSKQNYATPREFIKAVESMYGKITFDLAAEEGNKVVDGYFSIEQNSLEQEWHKIPGILWLNPPFDNIAPWARKCGEEAALGANIIMLTPASIGSNWFRDFVFPCAEVVGVNGRLCFDGVAPYIKDCMLSIFSPEQTRSLDVWNWKAQLPEST